MLQDYPRELPPDHCGACLGLTELERILFENSRTKRYHDRQADKTILILGSGLSAGTLSFDDWGKMVLARRSGRLQLYGLNRIYQWSDCPSLNILVLNEEQVALGTEDESGVLETLDKRFKISSIVYAGARLKKIPTSVPSNRISRVHVSNKDTVEKGYLAGRGPERQDVQHWSYAGGGVAFNSAIQLALHSGHKRIGFLGVDGDGRGHVYDSESTTGLLSKIKSEMPAVALRVAELADKYFRVKLWNLAPEGEGNLPLPRISVQDFLRSE